MGVSCRKLASKMGCCDPSADCCGQATCCTEAKKCCPSKNCCTDKVEYSCQGGTDCCGQANCCEQGQCESRHLGNFHTFSHEGLLRRKRQNDKIFQVLGALVAAKRR